jgi:hypothetical protein
MAHSTYNPEGLVTFMNKLEDKHTANPSAPLGIFQDHPSPFRRAASITKAMEDLGLKADVRKLRGVAYAKAEPVPDTDDKYRVVICDRVLCQPASIAGGPSSKDRASQTADKVNSALDNGVCCRDIVCDLPGQNLQVKSTSIFSVDPGDSALSGKTGAELLTQARSALEFAIWADWLSKGCSAEVDQNNER